MIIIYLAASLTLGFLTWTFAEYGLHNWYGHGSKGRNRFSREHLKHHTNGQYFAPTKEKALAAALALAIATPAAILIAGPLLGLCYAAAFSVTYLSYEWFHRRCHTHAPKTRYGAKMRKHHLHHHYTRPKENHGVTSPIWDYVFGTLTPSSTVRVPERKIFEVPWLVDENNEVLAEYADHYVIARPHAKRATNAQVTTATPNKESQAA